MGIKTVPQPPYSQDFAPCDFCLFPKLRGCRYETIEEMKAAVTKVFDTRTQENFHGAFQKLLVQQVHCSRRRLLRRGLEFHVCTINKSAHTKTYLTILVVSKVKLATIVEGDPKAPFSIATTPRCLVVNRIIRVRLQYSKPFNCVKSSIV